MPRVRLKYFRLKPWRNLGACGEFFWRLHFLLAIAEIAHGASHELYKRKGAKTVAYLSAEFLLGPHLAHNIQNLNLADKVREAMSALGLDVDVILEAEQEPGLGNGGLGPLAAFYMDSLATLEFPLRATAFAMSRSSGKKKERDKSGDPNFYVFICTRLPVSAAS